MKWNSPGFLTITFLSFDASLVMKVELPLHSPDVEYTPADEPELDYGDEKDELEDEDEKFLNRWGNIILYFFIAYII